MPHPAFCDGFIANPDLPARFRLNAPLARPQGATVYGGGASGNTDYPVLCHPGGQRFAGWLEAQDMSLG